LNVNIFQRLSIVIINISIYTLCKLTKIWKQASLIGDFFHNRAIGCDKEYPDLKLSDKCHLLRWLFWCNHISCKYFNYIYNVAIKMTSNFCPQKFSVFAYRINLCEHKNTSPYHIYKCKHQSLLYLHEYITCTHVKV
jgi:hypothetical protein